MSAHLNSDPLEMKNLAELTTPLQQLLDNVFKEQSCILKGNIKELKAILEERELLTEELRAAQEAKSQESITSEPIASFSAAKEMGEQIQKQMLTNRFLLSKKIQFVQTLLKKCMPPQPKTYDSYGQHVSGRKSNKVLINREG